LKLEILASKVYTHFMAIYIRNQETEALARNLAAQTHTSLTEAVKLAIQEKLERLISPIEAKTPQNLRAFVEALQAQSALDPVIDARQPDDILYDDLGLPQ
jgi:antitoxin VapB